MEFYNYEELLKKAEEKLVKKVGTADRFKIPQVITEISGPRTIVKNFAEVASALRRDPRHLSKYIFRELATPGFVDGNTLVLNSHVSRDSLQKKLESYIRDFVYCKVCKEPDTNLVKDDRLYFLKCEACGAKSPAREI